MTPALSAQELAWLAMQDDVESRLVFTERHAHGTDYRVDDGPFDQERFAHLADRDWTLLVQDVEKHLPDFRNLLAQVAFIPDWRIDDIMISYAVAGGSVGPHQDNYDVFLCQGSGSREWHLGDAGQPLAEADAGQLSLLQPFTDPAATVVSQGDVLYIPPGIPHWGIARNDCMTYSIGMRAPDLAELYCSFEREFPNSGKLFHKTKYHARVFYQDADLQREESSPGQISARAIERLAEQFPARSSLSDIELATMLGCVVTDLKAWLVPEPPCSEDLVRFCDSGPAPATLPIHGMARLAWWHSDDCILVFANGNCRHESHDKQSVLENLCAHRSLTSDSMRHKEKNELLGWLLGCGVFDLPGALAAQDTAN